MKKVMLDTDVLLDLLEKKEHTYQAVGRILSEKKKLKIKVFFTISSLEKIFDRLRVEKTEAESRDILRRIMQLGKAIETDHKSFEKAILSSFNDLEFAQQYYTADDHHMDYIVTNRILKGGSRKIAVLGADQFLNIIK